MEKSTRFVLNRVLAKNENNKFAISLFQRLEGSPAIPEHFWLWLNEYYDKPQDKTLKPIYDKNNISDLRFQTLGIRGFRKFPLGSQKSYYGIDFRDEENKPQSVYIVGSNGTGKTSIFSAIEDTFTRNIAAARGRGYKDNNAIQYILHAGTSPNDMDIVIKTDGGIVSVAQEDGIVESYKDILPAFFHSEYDIREIVDSKDSLRYIYKLIGLQEIYDIYNRVNAEWSVLKENYNGQNPPKRKAELIKEKELEWSVLDLLLVLFLDGGKQIKKEQIQKFLDLSKQKRIFQNKDIKKFSRKKKPSENDISQLSDSLNEIADFLTNEFVLLRDIGLHDNIIQVEYSKLINRCRNIVGAQGKEILPGITDDVTQIKKDLLLLSFGNIYIIRDTLFHVFSNNIASKKNKDFIANLVVQQQSVSIELDGLRKSLEDVEYANYECYCRYKTEVQEFLETLRGEINNSINHYNTISRNIFDKVLKDFSFNNEDIVIQKDPESGLIDIKIALDGNQQNLLSPQLYFNSFRFKLYCLCLKISIALSIKKIRGVNFPLVLDDVFYSSDFQNREKVKDFISKLYSIHDSLFGTKQADETYKVEPEKELQIIFFTHDDVVLDAAILGLRESKKEGMALRLFDYREIDYKTDKMIEIDAKRQVYLLTDKIS